MKTHNLIHGITALCLLVSIYSCSKNEINTTENIQETIDLPQSNSGIAKFKIQSEHGDLTQCDTLSKGNYLVWWDNDIDLKPQVSRMLDSIQAYQKTCVEKLGMQVPNNAKKGVYFNIYVHRGGDPEDYFTGLDTEFGNYVGGNKFDLPIMALPFDLINDFQNVAHETFHVFQDQQNSPGMEKDDSFWYYEATADWFSYVRYPNLTRSFQGAYMLTAIPEAPLWSFDSNFPTGYPTGWKRSNHSYALSNVLYYFSEIEKIDPLNITGSFYAKTNKTAQEYLYDAIGEGKMKGYFLNAAARMVNDHDFLTRAQYANSVELALSDDDQPQDNNQFVLELTDQGTSTWFRPTKKQVTNAWSFNTVKLNSTASSNYNLQFKGDVKGDFGSDSHFGLKIVVKKGEDVRFIDVNMTETLEAQHSLNLKDGETAYVVIASTPEVFQMLGNDYQKFSYQLKLDKEE